MSSNNSGLVLQCVATYAIAAPIATVQACTMQTSPTVAVVNELQVPLTENWIATDVYILAAAAIAPTAAVNPVISMDKNRGRQLVIRMFGTSTGLNAGAITTATFFVAISIV